jgi:hypothetical protein
MQHSATANIINTAAKIKHNHGLNIISNSNSSIIDLILYKIKKANILHSSCGVSTDWSLCVSTNYLDHQSIKTIMFQEYINGLVFIDNLPATYLKKEDLIILNNSLKNITKICFNESVAKAWPIKIDTMKIGIPEYPINEQNRKSIVLVSNQNIRQCRIIHQQILDILPDAGIITEFNNLDSIADNLNQYKVALIFDGYVNTLFASVCGCSIISNHTYDHDHILTFKDSNSLNDSIQKSIKNYDKKRNLDIRNRLLQSHSFEVFDGAISEIFIKQAGEPFTI